MSDLIFAIVNPETNRYFHKLDYQTSEVVFKSGEHAAQLLTKESATKLLQNIQKLNPNALNLRVIELK